MKAFTSLLALAAMSAPALAAPKTGRFGCASEPSAEILAAAKEMAVKEQSGDFMSIQAAIEVDVYFHVVASSTSEANGYVPDSKLANQLTVMNAAYAPHGIHFNLKVSSCTTCAPYLSAYRDVSRAPTAPSTRSGPSTVTSLL
jgi:hypothetical protein